MRHARSVFGSRAARGGRGARPRGRRAPAGPADARTPAAAALRRRGQSESQTAQIAGRFTCTTTGHDRHRTLWISNHAK